MFVKSNILTLLIAFAFHFQSLSQIDSIYYVEFSKSSDDFYIQVDTSRAALMDTLTLYDTSGKQIHQVTEFKSSGGSTYVNLGGNTEEGLFQGKLYKKGNQKIRVSYKKRTPLELLTEDRTFAYNVDHEGSIVIPVEFNNSIDPKAFPNTKLALFEKGTSRFVDYFVVKNDGNKFYLKSFYKDLKKGNYDGNVVFKNDEVELKQKVELNVKTQFWVAFIVFCVSFIVSHLVRYYARNEEKSIAYEQAKNLRRIIEKDTRLTEEEREKLIVMLNNHTFEIVSWLNEADYYLKAYTKINKEYEKLVNLKGLEAVKPKNDPSDSSLGSLKYGIIAMHLLITFALCLLVFITVYSSNPIFGSNVIVDYLKLCGGVLAVVLASSGLITERLALLESGIGKLP
ncbi:MAG: hypothetical protein P1U56_09685 [Saprospiraceae bacterium]|nr:hypothetical protein [Saprospiraceae bacterium]